MRNPNLMNHKHYSDSFALCTDILCVSLYNNKKHPPVLEEQNKNIFAHRSMDFGVRNVCTYGLKFHQHLTKCCFKVLNSHFIHVLSDLVCTQDS